MAYFDNAATTFPKPDCVYDFMDKFYREHGGNAGRGNHELSLTAGKLISDTRGRLQKILHCQNKQIIFTPTATIALNMILQGVIGSATLTNRSGEQSLANRRATVYISPFEHNAVTRVLHHFELMGMIKVKVLPILENLSYDFTEIENLFKKDEPDLLVISHASNVTGLIQPVEKLCLLAKKFDCLTVLDMAQTAGLVDLNVGLETIDFAVFAGHKTLYGPTGISGFAMKAGFDLSPVLFGGTGYESANQDMPKEIPQRYEMGTLNISGVAGLYASTGWILETGIESIWMKEQEHRKCLLEILRKYDFVKVVGNCHTDSILLTQNHGGMGHSELTMPVGRQNSKSQYVGIVSVLIEGLPSDTAASVFSEQNIAVRSGLQCAPLAHKTLGTFPAGTVRFSTSYFTGEEDFAELEEAMEFLKGNL
ncbi:aminotransferase class V-fold PLP-dependent enzyme [Treponema sp.]|uniref:aminotransferase class V-fold PLP-dependent enzyme n=1 Tax=Treponema sp. TaxID=166 RepID=UPI0025EEB00C|nr:aminotransferase class V-fold PLP-dependent enzyme [Treponema sp.]